MEKEIIKKAIDQLHVGQVIDEAFKRVIEDMRKQEKERVRKLFKIMKYYTYIEDNDNIRYIDISEEDFQSECNKIWEL